MTLRFRGKQVRFYGVCEANHGIGGLSLDGGPEVLVDEYGTLRETQACSGEPPLLEASTR